jgi:hypothetical protein
MRPPAHCTEYLRKIETSQTPLEITRHGKVVAVVNPPSPKGPATLAEWIGSGKGLMIEGAEDLFDEPTFEPGDFIAERENTEL